MTFHQRTTHASSRYRREDGEPCIDIAVENVERLLDNRDPAPFRERDLDPALVEYLLDAVDDLTPARRLRVIFWLKEPCRPEDIDVAYHAHFQDALARLARRNRERHRTGASALVVAMALLIVLLSAAELMRPMLTGTVGTALVEGVVILSWIVLWRPVDVLLYDWIPVRRERRLVKRLLDARVQLRSGTPPLLANAGMGATPKVASGRAQSPAISSSGA